MVEVEEDSESSNIEWGQKKGVDDQARASRRLDVKKIQQLENKSRTSFKTKNPPIKKLSPSLKKIRNKIKDIYDEDEEDEDEIIFTLMPENVGSSLLGALKEEEKQKLVFQQTLENQKMQETAGKREAISRADKVSKQLGLKGLKKKISLDNLQDATLSSETFDNALKQNISAKTKLKTKNLTKEEATHLANGLRKMQQAAQASAGLKDSAVESMNAEDLIKIGKIRDEKETAEMILEKSGRREAKKEQKKIENRKKIKQALLQNPKTNKEL